MFNFFLKSYRSGILNFCGSSVNVENDLESSDCLFGFRQYDNGVFNKLDVIKSSHPNMLKAVIVGKKSWGLWTDQWTEGIVEGTFTKFEILNEFEKRKIQIPESLKQEFENRIWQKRIKYCERMLKDFKK